MLKTLHSCPLSVDSNPIYVILSVCIHMLHLIQLGYVLMVSNCMIQVRIFVTIIFAKIFLAFIFEIALATLSMGNLRHEIPLIAQFCLFAYLEYIYFVVNRWKDKELNQAKASMIFSCVFVFYFRVQLGYMPMKQPQAVLIMTIGLCYFLKMAIEGVMKQIPFCVTEFLALLSQSNKYYYG